MPAAARVDDPITHTESQAQATTEMWEGIGAGILIGAALIALTVVTGGADLVVLGAVVAAGGTVLSLGGKGFLQGAKHGQQQVTAHGKVKTGSGNVTVNGRAAAAACLSTVQCDEHSGPQKQAEGSRTVSINGRMASRVGDRSVCDGVIGAGSDNVSIGGATGACAAIHKEVADWEKTLAKGAIVVGTVAQFVGMILTGAGAVRMVTMAAQAERALMMARMGAGLVGSLGLGAVGSNYGGRKYGEGSWQQEAFGTGAGLFGGFAGDAMASGGPRIIGGIKSGFEGLTEPGGVFGPGGLFGPPELAPAGGPGGFGRGGGPEIVPRAPGSPGMDAWNPPKSEPMRMAGAEDEGGAGSATDSPKTPQEISQASYDRAAEAKLKLSKTLDPLGNKTVSSAGDKDYLSGWKGKTPRDLPDTYGEVTPETVKAHADRIGHTLTRSGANDQIADGGFAGKEVASHGEKQALLDSEGKPTGVSKDMCGDCQEFFRKDAIYNDRINYNTDPNGQWAFHPDGTILRPDGEVIQPADKLRGRTVIRQNGKVLPGIPLSGM